MSHWIHNWFSNFEPFDRHLEHEGIHYQTPEHFFQAQKTNDRFHRVAISKLDTPGKAKKYASKKAGNIELRPDWEQIKLFVMEFALRHKFKHGTSWHKRLMDTGNEPIVERTNWHDNIWGNCECGNADGKHPECLEPGQNLLGKLLMKLRKEYRDSQMAHAVHVMPQKPQNYVGGFPC